MSARVVLAAATLVVLGACVYLFLQVRATPAAASSSASGGPVARVDEPEGEGDPTPAGSSRATTPRPTPTPEARPTSTSTAPAPDPGEPSGPTEDAGPDAKPYRLDAIMDEANKAFDRMDFDEARTIAQRVLKQQPNNVRMLRILVSSACIEGDGPEAQKHYNLLPARDREQMKTRCMRYQVQFTDPPETAPNTTVAPAATR